MHSKFKKPFVIILVAIVLINMWSMFLNALVSVPQCNGTEVTLTAVITADMDSNWVHGTDSNGKEVYGRAATSAQVGDTIVMYTSDGNNYWDVSEDLAFCDGVLNKSSGFLALGIRSFDNLTILAIVVDCIAGALFWFEVAFAVYIYLRKKRKRLCRSGC